MKAFTLVLALVISAVAQTQVGVAVFTATAVNGGIINGTALFTTVNSTHTEVFINVTGVQQHLNALHGIHVHQFGDISDLINGSSVGSHFDPNGQPHGCPELTDSRHVGDMGNWNVDINGNIEQTKIINLLQLTGENSIIGLAVVIHNDTDNCQNTTSAGKRLALGVIGIANVANNTASSDRSGTLVTVCVSVPTTTPSSYTGGYANFREEDKTFTAVGVYNGLNTTHANHVHQYGDLRVRDGTGAGGHYNPLNTSHAIPPVTPRHAGDLGNAFPYNGSNALYYYNSLTDGVISLTGANSILGRAVILHKQVDVCTQPVGGAGERIGFCVIGLGNSSAMIYTPTGFPPTTALTQDASSCTPAQSTTPDPTTSGSSGTTHSGCESNSRMSTVYIAAVFVLLGLFF